VARGGAPDELVLAVVGVGERIGLAGVDGHRAEAGRLALGGERERRERPAHGEHERDRQQAKAAKHRLSSAQRTKSRTCAYVVALSLTPECDRHAVWVFVAPERIVLVSGLITSSQGDHQVR
jgi:hypothetical protein